MVAVYVTAALFALWLAVMLYRVWRMVLADGETGAKAPGGSTGEVAVGTVEAGIMDNAGFNVTGGNRDGGSGGTVPRRLAVLVQDQAGGVEGFVHRLAAFLHGNPELRVALVDGGSTDETGFILERLARRYNMEFHRLAGEKCCCDGTTVPGRGRERVRCLDLRGLSRGELLLLDLHRAAGMQ
ncbi:hypothetical protein [Desulfallas thermosapovorans]|uniref:Glycosyl transferase family 2 n=1 Tax=Desulfallas thermosapovorans DSM 6562 TaxID=1121431 RepID=A0A5S4ZQ01_9FIRM|nr:hypothetical protein [Desulfallas thermosapovorans]TYO94808.1 hypothetical protein LX24_02060 [Desulfallas thermosapovorans DSM 6562]